MPGRTFIEKILDAKQGDIVFRKPAITLSHDNTASIEKVFRKMGGQKVSDPGQLLIVLDHNAPPTNCKLANDYRYIRKFVNEQQISRFHDSGEGICHQLMSKYAKPGMIIAGSDSHTCTAGAFNTLAVGIDRTETAGLWKREETWFRVPQSIKINLYGKLPKNVYAKDLALYIIGMMGSNGADYMSIEYHGEGIQTLGISDRMTIANLASEMGAKNAVFPFDEICKDHFSKDHHGIWADKDAEYYRTYDIDLSELYPLVACPHHVDNVKSVTDAAGIKIEQALIGTCTNGRIEDLRVAANILKGKQLPKNIQLLIIPASRDIYRQAMKEGLLEIFLDTGANILSPSCGPCLGTGQGIPADDINVISTANRNFLGRMGNKQASIYLASPATVAVSALKGEISSPDQTFSTSFPFKKKQTKLVEIGTDENRYNNGVWDYSDIDNLNTDQMFAGELTYEINSTEPEKIAPHLMAKFDRRFAQYAHKEDIILCGENFGCGSSREHPSVGFAYLGIQAIVVKSVSRIFFRSAINQGLPIIVLPKVLDAYKAGDRITLDLKKGNMMLHDREYQFSPLPDKLLNILKAGGLVKSMEYKN